MVSVGETVIESQNFAVEPLGILEPSGLVGRNALIQ